MRIATTNQGVAWPDNRQFAFTIFDDTDGATLETVRPVYELLADLGLRTTKSVWMLRGSSPDRYEGDTCEDAQYLEWVLSLQKKGFEIAIHNVSWSTSARERVAHGLESFRSDFGHPPRIHCNHSQCAENIYWGDARLTGTRRLFYNVLTRGRNAGRFRGHLEGDELFWGDLCRENVTYVRNFVFRATNTLKTCPMMPYHDPARPWVRFWFASTDGRHVSRFCSAVADERIDSLEAEGGLCIMYTHFASGFVNSGKVDPTFRDLMTRLAARNGWFVPVATILDLLRDNGDETIRTIPRSALQWLEWRWLFDRAIAFGT